LRYLCDTSFLIDLISGDEGAVEKAGGLMKELLSWPFR